MSGAGRVGRHGKKTRCGLNLLPIQRIFDLTDAFFPGGMLDTIRGSTIYEDDSWIRGSAFVVPGRLNLNTFVLSIRNVQSRLARGLARFLVAST
jgi:hypothetical protein